MRVDSLTLKDFTVFSDANFEFSPGLNVLIGANGTGKSHVLKVLYSITRSFSVTGLTGELGPRRDPRFAIGGFPTLQSIEKTFRPQRGQLANPLASLIQRGRITPR